MNANATIPATLLKRAKSVLAPVSARLLPDIAVRVNGHVDLIATDLDTRVTVSLDCEHDGDALAYVDRKEFFRAAPAKTDVPVAISDTAIKVGASSIPVGSLTDSRVITGADGTITTEQTPRREERVEFNLGDTISAIMGAQALGVALDMVRCATDPDSKRYALGGVLLSLGEDTSVAATDALRLHHVALPACQCSEWTGIIPIRAVDSLIAACKGASDVWITAGTSGIRFRVVSQSDEVTIETRLVEGRFPRWRDIIPTTPAARKVMMRSIDLVRALKPCVSLHRMDGKAKCRVAVHLSLGGRAIGVSAIGDTARIETAIPLAMESPGPLTKITLDPAFLVDAARDEMVMLELRDKGPIMVYSGALMCAMMPME